jgi:hypothetical protein
MIDFTLAELLTGLDMSGKSEMVERVTEAITKAETEWLDSDRSISLQEATARAAIAAMREPTEDMVRAVYMPPGVASEGGDPEGYWRSMIDAALK